MKCGTACNFGHVGRLAQRLVSQQYTCKIKSSFCDKHFSLESDLCHLPLRKLMVSSDTGHYGSLTYCTYVWSQCSHRQTYQNSYNPVITGEMTGYYSLPTHTCYW